MHRLASASTPSAAPAATGVSAPVSANGASPAESTGLSPYRGRFAPSPTGPLHFGSLVAATASYLCARAAGGAWLVRIEDIDPPREVPGSADQILATLEAFGFEWTESILRQSTRTEAYEAALAELQAGGWTFVCSCSRTDLKRAQPEGRDPSDELYYPGWCRNGTSASERRGAIRFRVPPGAVCFDDQIQGPQCFDPAREVGDFVVRRRDRLFAYQLATALDDAAQRITHVVRGADLLSSTARQMLVQRALGLPSPVYAHLPVVTDTQGIKLSKSTGAAAIDARKPELELWRALDFLRQEPPHELSRARVGTLWEWAIEHWRIEPLRGLARIPLIRRTS
ncbi:MAG TPA: tRNA glutamyl-Q(34) synthetase GluQRS [Steroidobacteraceae bacterium]